MMREVPARGQERWLPILVPTVPGHRLERRQCLGDRRAILRGEPQRIGARVVLEMRALAEPRADDHPAHGGGIEDIPRGDIGD